MWTAGRRDLAQQHLPQAGFLLLLNTVFILEFRTFLKFKSVKSISQGSSKRIQKRRQLQVAGMEHVQAVFAGFDQTFVLRGDGVTVSLREYQSASVKNLRRTIMEESVMTVS